MSSTTINSSPSQTLKTSKIPIPIPNNSGRESVSEAKKPPFERGKSGGQLKQRLASAVSAKIAAANKDGRTTGNNNRGIEYLLQRKKQPDSRLNTKAIAFQKPVRNNNGDPVKSDRSEASKIGGNLKGPNDLSRPVLQKSLLNALMSSRKPSGLPQGKSTTVGSKVDPSANRSSTVAVRSLPLGGANTTSNIGKAFSGETARNGGENNSRTSSLQGRNSELSYGLPQGKPTTVGSKVDPSANRSSMVAVRSLPLGGANTPSNIGKTFAGETARNGGENNSRTSSLQGRKPEQSYGFKKLTLNENGVNKPSSSLREQTVVKLKDPIIKPKLEEKVIGTNTLDTDGKQMSEKTIFPAKQVSPNKQLLPGTENRGSPAQTNAKPTVAPKPNSHFRSKMALGKRSGVLKKQDYFREDLLETLEANVGSCKIAAFQAMEDFSVLRMRVYRIRGDLERLKREREKRTPL